MAFFGLCPGAKTDPILTTLRDVFSANPLKVPEQRFKPLSVLAFRKGKACYLGNLTDLFYPIIRVPPGWIGEPQRMAEVEGHVTQHIAIDAGLDILQGLFSAFGSDGAGLRTSFNRLTQISFSFDKVQRQAIETNRLGRLVSEKTLNLKNPVLPNFSGNVAADFLVIDSVIQSNNFSVHIDRSQAANVNLKVPEVAQYLGNVKMDEKQSSGLDLRVTFQGTQFLTFAFTCVRFFPDTTGRIHLIAPELRGVVIANAGTTAVPNPDHILLSEGQDLLILDKDMG
jgi:hypothetical protein